LLIPWELLCEDNAESQHLLKGLLEVAAADPLIFDEVMRGVLHSDPCIQGQAAGMIEKITQERPLFLTPYKRVLLKEVAAIEQIEVRQQVALLYGRVFWDEWDLKQVVTLLGQWIETQSSKQIVKNALQSLQTLAMQKEWINSTYLKIVEEQQRKNKVTIS